MVAIIKFDSILVEGAEGEGEEGEEGERGKQGRQGRQGRIFNSTLHTQYFSILNS
ncbi:MAG: hypothetical protein KME17_19080 [Cyanosarcina radialis HA8281-LM2]|jgi:hypothetical protein|nr:hypothetical protein [Cyanosarcina radialis HA8281-LM2]